MHKIKIIGKEIVGGTPTTASRLVAGTPTTAGHPENPGSDSMHKERPPFGGLISRPFPQ